VLKIKKYKNHGGSGSQRVVDNKTFLPSSAYGGIHNVSKLICI
jgi:hypothetical protein